MKFKLEINLDNASFEPIDSELNRLLSSLAKKLEDSMCCEGDKGRIQDSNGNTVGEWKIE